MWGQSPLTLSSVFFWFRVICGKNVCVRNMNVMFIKVLFAVVVLLSLSSCKDDFVFDVVSMEFIDEKITLESNGSSISVVGFVKATLRTDIDVVTYSEIHSFNLWYEVKGCESGKELSIWPDIYKKFPKSNAQYEYEVVFSYKKYGESGQNYNLSEFPEDLCFRMGSAGMNPFTGHVTNVLEVDLPGALVDMLKQYDERSNEAEIQVIKDVRFD